MIASSGGHWIQLSRLAVALAEPETYYATTLDGATPPTGIRPVTVITDASRSEPLKFARLGFQILRMLLKVRPHVIITTGAAPGLLALCVGKLFGARTVWIDSLANVAEVSLSGRIAARFADLWLTQWPHLANKRPRLGYLGSVL